MKRQIKESASRSKGLDAFQKPFRRELTMNWDEVSGKWNQFKGDVKQRWGKLTDDDLTVINGKKDTLIGKIQERYGITKDAAQEQVSSWKMPSSTTRETSERESSEQEIRRKAS